MTQALKHHLLAVRVQAWVPGRSAAQSNLSNSFSRGAGPSEPLGLQWPGRNTRVKDAMQPIRALVRQERCSRARAALSAGVCVLVARSVLRRASAAQFLPGTCVIPEDLRTHA